ncbi:DUF3572 family protein [Paracoccus sp. p4-l81]|uniref:DUF3572 family protein n=1 Tax=unclassified Paracoccus (in: a-proteobacteria) TaxID=2688777 RepID=UPI0035BA3650
MKKDEAEVRALAVLGWLAGDEALMSAFLAQSGMAPGDLAQVAGDAGFLAAVMDFVLAEDARVLGAAEALETRPDGIAAIARALSGDLPHWT